MQLKVCCVARGLRHCPDDAWKFRWWASAQQTREDITKSRSLMQVVENDDGWKLFDRYRGLLGNVTQVLLKLLR